VLSDLTKIQNSLDAVASAALNVEDSAPTLAMNRYFSTGRHVDYLRRMGEYAVTGVAGLVAFVFFAVRPCSSTLALAHTPCSRRCSCSPAHAPLARRSF
jgi:hypothetical protein